MTPNSRLGDYLRARRDLVRPEDMGLPAGTRRRVHGLHREEVALLAGISCEYYLRLEQGRDQHPSRQVRDALARALMLDDDATAHLHALAGPAPRRRGGRPAERVPEGVRQLVMSHTDLPAFVHGRYLDVLIANPQAAALSPGYRTGVNLLRAAFLDPEVRALHEDWPEICEGAVAAVRAMAGPDTDDPRLTGLVGELAVRSEEFRRLWARQDVGPRTSGVSRIKHPHVGLLELHYQTLAVTGTDGQVLVIHHARPGSGTAEALTLLAGLAVSAPGRPAPTGADSPTR